jgi:hypothetical protein
MRRAEPGSYQKLESRMLRKRARPVRRGEVRKGLNYDTTCGETKRVGLDENSTSLAPYPTSCR